MSFGSPTTIGLIYPFISEFIAAQLVYLMPDYKVVMDGTPDMKPWIYLSYAIKEPGISSSSNQRYHYYYHVITDGSIIMEVTRSNGYDCQYHAIPDHVDIIVDPLVVLADMKKYVNSLGA